MESVAYLSAFHSQDQVRQAFLTAYHATKDEYADVYDSKLEAVVSILLSGGTQCILDGYLLVNGEAKLYATFASFFEEWIAIDVRKTKATVGWAKIVELCGADEHTLVSYYRKRIPCSCLDEKYKEVKSVKKMGFCYNLLNCSHPDGRVERSKMLCCTRCGEANYRFVIPS